MDNLTKETEISAVNLAEKAIKNGNDVRVGKYKEVDFLVKFNTTGNEYIVDKDGNITYSGTNSVSAFYTIKSWASNSNTDFHKESIRNIITEIEFVDYIPNPLILNEDNCWDVSEKDGDKNIIAWLEGTKLYIGGDGGVKANKDSSYIFYNFKNAINISFNNKYDTSDVINMSYMFANSVKLEKLDLRCFNTSNVTNMSYMFFGGTIDWGSQTKMALKEINVSSFDTSNVTTMNSMFANCGNIEIFDLSNFDTSKVTDMYSLFNMPNDLSAKVRIIKLGEKWDTKKVKTMKYMFCDCANMQTIYLSQNFDTNEVTDSVGMFEDDKSLVGGCGTRLSTSYLDKTYARIDKVGQPGYFTDIKQDLIENNIELEYIESTGTQYIDTGVVANDVNEIDLRFNLTQNDTTVQGIIGGGYSSNQVTFQLIRNGNSISLRYGKTQLAIPYDNAIHDIKISKNNLIIDENEENNSSTINDTRNVVLFCRGKDNLASGIQQCGHCKIYFCKIYNDAELIRDFIPVYNKIANSAGLYDKVEGKFYRNVGTGSFIEGK